MSVFTHRDEIEGKVGIGRLPPNLNNVLDDISKEYYKRIFDRSATTYHTYYSDLSEVGNLKSNFEAIQYAPFWDNICDDDSVATKCIHYPVTEMNEMYYSNPKPAFDKTNLYGAAANLIPHRDCILYNFDGIRFYRAIVGLTDNNDDTATEFLNFHIGHKINRGDYMIFDFDKTLHQVKKTGHQETPRILLKLHFIVCEDCRHSARYVRTVSNFYIGYYFFARYTEQIGTDPRTFMGFFWGLLWEWAFYSAFKYCVLLLFISNVILLNRVYKIEYKLKNAGKLVVYSFSNVVITHIVIVVFYYGRYILVGIR